LEDEICLAGYDVSSPSIRTPATLRIRLYRFLHSTPSDDYKVFLHLIRPGNPAQVAQANSAPIGGYGPTTRWEPGELIADEHEFELPKDLPAGNYQVLGGMYRPSTMQNLTVQNADQVLPGERIVLVTVRVADE
jgi:hypothetical protein